MKNGFFNVVTSRKRICANKNRIRFVANAVIFAFAIGTIGNTSFSSAATKRVEDNANLLQTGGIISVSSSLKTYLSERTDFEQFLYERLLRMETSIDTSDYNISYSDFFKALQNVINHCPDLFYVGTHVSTYQNSKTSTVMSYVPEYLYSETKVSEMRKKFNYRVDSIIDMVDPSWSDMEKALFVHDYIISQSSYDTTHEKSDAYSLLVDGTAVCQGYTLAFTYIMEKLGIESRAVSSASMNHIWNEIKLGSSWYHVDLTYDDPVPDMLGAAKHDFFLLSDEAMEASSVHYGWEAMYKCTSTAFDNSFWENSRAPFVYINNEWFYYRTEGDNIGIYTWNPKTGSRVKIKDLNGSKNKWYITNTTYYTSNYSGLVGYDSYLFYNTPTSIKCIDVTSPTYTTKTVITPNISGKIFGIQFKDGIVNYTAGTSATSASSNKSAFRLEAFDADAWKNEPDVDYTPVSQPQGDDVLDISSISDDPDVDESSDAPVSTPIPTDNSTNTDKTDTTKPVVDDQKVDNTDTQEYSTITKSIKLKVTAKKGRKKITIKTVKKATVKLTSSKKLFLKGKSKKGAKLINIAKSKNKKGTVRIKTRRKLAKWDKFKVQVKYKGLWYTKNVIVK
ncbi:MAG: hypothetical protein K6G63_10425 [Eubacterium sp.]|nr:hypothetical protein [Eubacterium sp.]